MNTEVSFSVRRLLVAVVTLLAVVAAMALSGCQGGSDTSGKPEAVGNRAADEASSLDGSNAADIESVSTAMVVYKNGGEVLFVDQDTGALYYPTLLDDAIVGLDGDDIDGDELVVGNIVQVTGDGIMLESFPGQYPGIVKVEVIEQGNPADADRYADLLEGIVVTADPAEVPSGYVEYTTDIAQTSVMLAAFEYSWVVPDDGNANQSLELDGDCTDDRGAVASSVADVRIQAATDAIAGFSVAPTNVVVERTALVAGSEVGSASVNPAVEDEPVAAQLQSDGSVAFTMEPGYLYELDVDFAQGEASYAFYTLA